MCMFGFSDPQVQASMAESKKTGQQMQPDMIKRLILGGFGDFNSRVREAGLGTSVAPKSLGTVITDPVGQSK